MAFHLLKSYTHGYREAFGWGLGYCGEILRERTKRGARIIVFEPDEELFKLSLAEPTNRTVFEDPRFRFVIGPKVRQFFDDWTVGECQETDKSDRS